jgi:purine-binding chemotaxis protein CheW
VTAALAGSDRYLLLDLGPDRYALQVECVDQIVELQPPTPVRRAPPWLRGLMNLRGRVLPLVDLRVLLALPAVDAEFQACVVVVAGPAGPVGLVVDRVHEVATIPPASIDPAPETGTTIETRYLAGVARAGGRLVLVMDARRAFSPDDIGLLRRAAEERA